MATLKGVIMLFVHRPTCIKRLLIIEDDPLTAFDNEHTLKHSGYEIVATVDSGEAAVPIIAAGIAAALGGVWAPWSSTKQRADVVYELAGPGR